MINFYDQPGQQDADEVQTMIGPATSDCVRVDRRCHEADTMKAPTIAKRHI